MTTSQARFKCTDDKRLQGFECSMEFQNCDSNADKVKLYESFLSLTFFLSFTSLRNFFRSYDVFHWNLKFWNFFQFGIPSWNLSPGWKSSFNQPLNWISSKEIDIFVFSVGMLWRMCNSIFFQELQQMFTVKYFPIRCKFSVFSLLLIMRTEWKKKIHSKVANCFYLQPLKTKKQKNICQEKEKDVDKQEFTCPVCKQTSKDWTVCRIRTVWVHEDCSTNKACLLCE